MGYIYQTEVVNIEYKRNTILKSAYVRWWLYEQDEEGDTDARPFTYEELGVFERYTVANEKNFPMGGKNYHNAEQFEAPSFELYDLLPLDVNELPSYVVLRSNPKLSTNISKVMDVQLSPVHKYGLPFNVIGEIIR